MLLKLSQRVRRFARLPVGPYFLRANGADGLTGKPCKACLRLVAKPPQHFTVQTLFEQFPAPFGGFDHNNVFHGQAVVIFRADIIDTA